MEKKTKKFLRCSVIVELIVCISVFVWLTVFMSQKTENTIVDVSEIYLSEMSTQIRQKFTSLVGLRLEQVEGVIRRTPPNVGSYEGITEGLQTSAGVRGFRSLGYCAEDGTIETIYGKQMEFINLDDLEETLAQNGSIVEQGISEDGEKLLILGKKAAYEMKNGEKSVALVAAVPMEYLNDALFLDEDGAMVYSHVIDEDGSYVIRNADAYRHSYFERIREEFGELDSKDADTYVWELQEAISARENYSTLVLVQGEQRHVYCAPLSENSNWYLITVMPDGVLDKSITDLDTLRIWVILASLFVILLTMLVIFVLYYRLSRQQVEELDKAKEEAERANKAKSEFLSSMSHDIRTPMNAILGMTEIALKNVKDTERVEECLKKVKLSGKHLLGLINDVLDMSKIESGKMTLNVGPLSLRETMDDIVNIMQPQVKQKHQIFDIFIQNIIAEEVYCDSVRLNQILLNILSNAVKFTPEKGMVDVFICQEPSPKGTGFVRTHFKVKDNGIGMSREFQEKIFDSFARENTEQVQNITGTGLGMSITKYIVDMMGGSIELESEPGVGSEFHVVLDLKVAQITEEDMTLPPWNVLVVDDNRQLCLSAVSILEELGIHAEWTQDGNCAVQMIEKRHKQNDEYHFVLVDWKMPHKDGMETIREIHRKIGRHIPMFLISAYDWNDITEEVDDEEIEGFISKPLFKSTLYSCLSKYVGGNAETAELQEGQTIDFEGRHILLAEDIDMNWEIANEILATLGLVVERAVNGQICVDKFEQSGIGFYDAVLMDIRMPVMNGYDAARTIRALDRPDHNLPIIAMTADAFSDDIQNCLRAGMNAHIAKPIDIKELVRVLQKYLGV